MATQVDPKELDIRAQMASIDEALANAARARIEAKQREVETKFEPRKFWLSAVVAAGGLIGVTITLTKLFL